MRKWIAVFAVFALAAVVAAYAALFPLAPMGSAALQPTLEKLDATAGRAVALAGRSAAVVLPLAAGLVAALLLALAGRPRKQAFARDEDPVEDKTSSGQQSFAPLPDTLQRKVPPGTRSTVARQGRRRKPAHPDPELVWRPEPDPVAPEIDHVPGLPRENRGQAAPIRNDLASEADGSSEVPMDNVRPMPLTGPLPPVVLMRRPRNRDIDEQAWFDSASWLGGLPRLGDRAWPRDEHGPLPFAAQIDLADLMATAPGNPLPRSGSLAFFLGSGAIVEVPEGSHSFTAPPEDLPPAFDEGGYPLPAHPSRLSRPFFPFWPVDLIGPEWPESVAGAASGENVDQRCGHLREMVEPTQASSGIAPRDKAYTAQAPVSCLWWHSALHLADCLQVAIDGAARHAAMEEERLADAQARIERLKATPHASHADIEEARAALCASEVELPALEAEWISLVQMTEAMEGFVADRDPWAPLNLDGIGVIEEALLQIHHDCARLARFCVPQTLAELATISLRAMVTGDTPAFAQVPVQELARINSSHLAAIGHPHQIFGPPCQTGGDASSTPVRLLRLGHDDMVEWNWGDIGALEFRIAAEDLAAGRWTRATLTVEPG